MIKPTGLYIESAIYLLQNKGDCKKHFTVSCFGNRCIIFYQCTGSGFVSYAPENRKDIMYSWVKREINKHSSVPYLLNMEAIFDAEI